MIKIDSSGSFRNAEDFLNTLKKLNIAKIAAAQAEKGVAALASATPNETGKTARSWDYNVEVTKNGGCTINWTNNDINKGFRVALALQYGHGTGTGGYVQGRDYINPAIRPIFDQIAETVWRAVMSA